MAVHYFWDEDEDNVIEEYDDAGETVATYTTEPTLHGRVISQNRGGVESFYHYDGEGNTRALTDINGDVTDTYDYDAFGDVIASTGNTTNPFGYKGALGYYANPETNDYYVRARNYEPTIARWLSADPAGFVDGMNLYAYVMNDPVNRMDFSGLKCVICKWDSWFKKIGIGAPDAFVVGDPYLQGASASFKEIHNKTSIPYSQFPRTYGPFTLKGKKVYVAGAVFAINAEICETNPGDCVVTVTEEVTGFLWKKGKWTVDPEDDHRVVIPALNYKPNAPGMAMVANLSKTGIIRPRNACKTMVVFVDVPWIPVNVGDKQWRKRVVGQTITIHEGQYWDENSGATFKHEFHQGITQTAPFTATFKSINQKQWLFGDPSDCC